MRVNGRVVRELGTVVAAGDEVTIDGVALAAQAKRYLVLHKPIGVVTTMRDPQHRKTIADLVPPGARIVPVGRLDYDTSGVVLLTNDGELVNRLLHPRFGVEKTYRAVVAGRLSTSDLAALASGIDLGEARTAGAKVRVLTVKRDRSIVDITLHEGRNRQVRRMFAALGHPVVQLARLRFGPIRLGALPAGHSRPLSAREFRELDAYRGDGG